MTVDTRTFHPGEGLLTTDPDGVPALNTWRPITRGPHITVDVTPFIEQINYLFGEDAERFLDWLAHIEQRPGELPHTGWLHIAPEFGCGRGWVSSVLSRLWRGYVAPSLDLSKLIGSDYNGALAGRLIAIVDEIREGAREDAYMMEGKFREIMTVESRMINPKYGTQYSEHNACRWLVFSNHKSAMPLDVKDRRWNVCTFDGKPREEWVYAQLYKLLGDPAFIDSIGVFLSKRDISNFNPGGRAALNQAKLDVVSATRSEYRQLAEEIVKHWPTDIILWSDIQSVMGDGNVTARVNLGAVRHALEDSGMTRYPTPVWLDIGKTTRVRVWIVRNARTVLTYNAEDLRDQINKIPRDFNFNAHKYLMSLI